MSKLFVIVGRSGCGKTATCDLLEERRKIKQIRTYTTKRRTRPNDDSHIFADENDYLYAKKHFNIVAETEWKSETDDRTVRYWTLDSQIDGNYQTIVVDNNGLKQLQDTALRFISILIVSDRQKRLDNLMSKKEETTDNNHPLLKAINRMNRDKDFEIVPADYTVEGNCELEELYNRIKSIIDMQ
jgi:guanylate kinase